MHGMLRKASAACGFASYNPTIVDRARTCFDALGSRRGAEAMHTGAAEFERWQFIRNYDALCGTLAAKFSDGRQAVGRESQVRRLPDLTPGQPGGSWIKQAHR